MLRITIIELLVGDLVFFNKDNTIDKMDSNSKICQVIVKNTIILDYLAQFKLLVELSSRVDFLTLEARLLFIKLKQAFINVPIFHHFDLKYNIWIKTDVLDNVINEILS